MFCAHAYHYLYWLLSEGTQLALGAAWREA